MSGKTFSEYWHDIASTLSKLGLPDFSGTKRIKRFYLCHKEASNTLGLYSGDISIKLGRVDDNDAKYHEMELPKIGTTIASWEVLAKHADKIREIVSPYLSNGQYPPKNVVHGTIMSYETGGVQQSIHLDTLVNDLNSQIAKYDINKEPRPQGLFFGLFGP